MADIPKQPADGASSQDVIDSFWKSSLVSVKPPDKPLSILPSNVYAQMVGNRMPQGAVGGRIVTASYEEAVRDCEAKVNHIVAECRRSNKKYTDPHFDLDDSYSCLRPLSDTLSAEMDEDESIAMTFDVTQRGTSTGGPINRGDIRPTQQDQQASGDEGPPCAKRVSAIFDNPKFYVGRGADIKDLRQGAEGDCWLISSLGSLCVGEESQHLIGRICPEKARDEKVGVYGFVFNRDGEWISEIVDDKLYLRCPDYDDCDDARRTVWDGAHSRLDPSISRELYRKTFQLNSDALYYGSCAHPDETWFPLIEKAFAKAHGDYEAISGGWPGEGVEDLTGGISTEIMSDDILDEDYLWTEGFLRVNKEFLFGVSTRQYGSPDPDQKGRQGIEDGHAYTVLKAVEYSGNRLLLVKNPWGKTEWNGPWSDGSKEWTPEALKALDHTFGDEGIFWIPYKDLLRRYERIWRTRLFTPEWCVSQHWTTIQVPWAGDYNNTKFEFVLPKTTRAVVVLSQLDNRYFQGLTGQYSFELAFRLHQSGETIHITRGYSSGERSAVAEVDLEAGTYEVLLQISGSRDSAATKREDVVKQNWLTRRDKLLRIGLSYDLAHAKGQIEKTEAKDTSSTIQDKVAAIVQPVVAITTSNETAPAPAIVNPPAPVPATTVPAIAAPAEVKAPVEDPWNASCVVGLRVFSQDSPATIRVITTAPEDVTVHTKTRLDVDDPEKDAAEKDFTGAA